MISSPSRTQHRLADDPPLHQQPSTSNLHHVMRTQHDEQIRPLYRYTNTANGVHDLRNGSQEKRKTRLYS